MQAFPFDVQDFTITMKAEETTNEVDILPFPRGGDFFAMEYESSVTPDWLLDTVLCEFIWSDKELSKAHKMYPQVLIHVKAKRKWMAQIQLFIYTGIFYFLGLVAFSMVKPYICFTFFCA